MGCPGPDLCQLEGNYVAIGNPKKDRTNATSRCFQWDVVHFIGESVVNSLCPNVFFSPMFGDAWDPQVHQGNSK